ncbi:MAG: GtrA family protein [Casimicrobiaceae bacterium]|nr:GtrA family protein [Casimicrobiaceae bacterium]MCX8098982.1 GtrA family protein [Casimicrobiaceae bacterium]MDW8313089.1 GtrA family protein [Burkholderiales bacterium]
MSRLIVDKLPAQALRYFLAACLALVLDVATVLLSLELGAHAVLARALGLFVGLCTTYACSLLFVFPLSQAPSVLGFLRYSGVQSLGTALNYGLSTLLLAWAAQDRFFVMLAVTAGAAAGFLVNFYFARRLLYRPPR